MFNKKTVKDINLKGKTVICRIDWDVPADKVGHVTDDFRIRASVPTINYLLEQNCKIILLSKRGRPKARETNLSMEKVAERASQILDEEVLFVNSVFDQKVINAVNDLRNGQILCLENLRFEDRENTKDMTLATDFASLGEVFVFDAFAMAHRKEPSCIGINKYLPSVAGLLLEKEITQLQLAINNPAKPVVAITGGSKLETKLPLLENFIKLADKIVVAGVMANTLLAAKGYYIGKSVYEEDMVEQAKAILNKAQAAGVNLLLPTADVAVGQSIEEKSRRIRNFVTGDTVQKDEYILDFGPESTREVIGLVRTAGTVIWNGPLGYYENPVFAEASQKLAQAIAESSATSIVGGGDTADVVNGLGLADKFTHVSTGGGASLELLAGHKLPGVEVLLDK